MSPCVITAQPASISVSQDGTTTLQISHNGSNALSISSISSKPSELQVSPSGQTLGARETATFTIKAKKSAGSYTATFTASCGQVVVPVTVY